MTARPADPDPDPHPPTASASVDPAYDPCAAAHGPRPGPPGRVELPLSVWATGQRPSAGQRAGRYVPAAMAHPGKMLPAIAARAITEYTQPGDLVLDPMCGIGTTLVEAIHLGRDAVGVEYEPPWAQLARRNLHHAASQGARGHGRVVTGDARQIGPLLGDELAGRVALLLTSPPYGASLHGHVTAIPGQGVVKSDYRYSRDRNNLAHVGLDRLLAGMVDILAGCTPLMRPGGIVAMTVRPYWSRGTLIDLPGRLTAALVEHTELALLDRNVALLAGIREDRLVPRASFFQLGQVRAARAHGLPRHITAHEDILVWINPATAAVVADAGTPARPDPTERAA